MDRGHQALLDAERFVQHLGHRGQTVRGAAGVRDALVLFGQLIVIDAQNDGEIRLVFGRGREHDFASPRVQVTVVTGLVVGLCGRKEPGRFERNVDVQLFPGELAGVLFGTNSDALSINDQAVALGLNSTGKPALHAVVLEEHRQVLGIAQVVDGDDFEFLRTSSQSPKRNAPNSTKTIDSDAHCHSTGSLLG